MVKVQRIPTKHIKLHIFSFISSGSQATTEDFLYTHFFIAKTYFVFQIHLQQIIQQMCVFVLKKEPIFSGKPFLQ